MGTPRKRDKQKPNGGERRGTDGRKSFPGTARLGVGERRRLDKVEILFGWREGRKRAGMGWERREGRVPEKVCWVWAVPGKRKRSAIRPLMMPFVISGGSILFPEGKIGTTKTPDAVAVEEARLGGPLSFFKAGAEREDWL